MTKYRLYFMDELYCETEDINIHQNIVDRLYEANILQHAREERIKND